MFENHIGANQRHITVAHQGTRERVAGCMVMAADDDPLSGHEKLQGVHILAQFAN